MKAEFRLRWAARAVLICAALIEVLGLNSFLVFGYWSTDAQHDMANLLADSTLVAGSLALMGLWLRHRAGVVAHRDRSDGLC
jgi:hypothetical protein